MMCIIKKMAKRAGIVINNEKGFTSVEYGVMLALVVVLAVAVGSGVHNFVVDDEKDPSEDTIVGALKVKAMNWVDKIDLGAEDKEE